MIIFWIIGVIISYIGIGICFAAIEIRKGKIDEDNAVVLAIFWPLCATFYIIMLITFVIRWTVLRLAGKNYSWEEFKND